MSHPSHSDRLSSICDDARTLTDQSRDHQKHLEALAEAAIQDMLTAKAELLDGLDSSPIEKLRSLLRAQLLRRVDGARTAAELLGAAREQCVAATRLLSRVNAERSRENQRREGHSRGIAVVVADDYREVRELVSLVLQKAGFVVRTAANGVEALIAAHEMRPAVIVMDVTMPVLDGIEATRLIKATDATRHARVIAYTGNPTLGDNLVGELFVAVLQKPATPDVVVQMVRKAASL
jgi:two-component system cell cycle response regulator DivK